METNIYLEVNVSFQILFLLQMIISLSLCKVLILPMCSSIYWKFKLSSLFHICENSFIHQLKIAEFMLLHPYIGTETLRYGNKLIITRLVNSLKDGYGYRYIQGNKFHSFRSCNLTSVHVTINWFLFCLGALKLLQASSWQE